MFYQNYWGDNSPGQVMAKEYQLPSPNPFLGSTAKSPKTEFVFESNGAFYLWSATVDTVCKITEPGTKEEIIETIVNDDSINLMADQIFPPTE